jgi:hypothetical protein
MTAHAPFRPFPLGTRNGEGGWKGGSPDLPGLSWPRFESGHLLRDATTHPTVRLFRRCRW